MHKRMKQFNTIHDKTKSRIIRLAKKKKQQQQQQQQQQQKPWQNKTKTKIKTKTKKKKKKKQGHLLLNYHFFMKRAQQKDSRPNNW